MSQLMLINPKARRAGGRKKSRSAAQVAATKRLVAFNRARRSGKRSTAKRSTAVVRRASPVGLARITKRSSVARKRNPAPALLATATSMVMPSLKGAGGALVVNTALNYMPFLPPMLKSGNGKYLARAGLALVIGVLGEKVMPHKLAANMAVGALTVALHDLILGIASQAMPTLQLGDVGDYDTGVSAYEEGDAVAGYIPQNNMAGMDVDVYDTSGGVSEYIAH